MIAIASSVLVVGFYLFGGRASITLLPGFYLSGVVTVNDHAAFGTAYILLGLFLNILLFAAIGIGARRIVLSITR